MLVAWITYVTDYKAKLLQDSDCRRLSEELNTLYACFEANTISRHGQS